ncbi:trypsin-like peptidase domain-containing protein [Calothrix rhizosoleniae]|uniref:WD40 domain-containing protein n=1 Tax=Calothrix rhizosoleniae TaxID=888997 RepID=UPI000B49F9EA|nr:trypsin-like peptidase domain-containing protein [Calothrix rhizosoleniae]
MKFAYGIPVILLATNVMVLHQVAMALTGAEVEDIAKQVTVRIDGAKRGTGIIVNQQGNTYTVLTNWHVVEKGNYTVQTLDGRRYQFSSTQVKRLIGADLAEFTFTSNQNYRVATRGNSDQLSIDTKVYVAGWANPDKRCARRCWKFRGGQLSERLSSAIGGYTLSYTNITKPGMSGGPLLNQEGHVVGINGQSQTHSGTGAVEYVAIPINTYMKLASAITPPPSRTFTPSPTPIATLSRAPTGTNFTFAKTLTGHSYWVISVAFSPDGKTLASGSLDKTIKIWDVGSGKQLKSLTGHSDLVSSVAFSPDGRTLASGSSDKSIKIWDVGSGKQLKSLSGHSYWVHSMVFSPDGRTLASGSSDHSIKIWDVGSGKQLKTLSGHSDSVYSVAFSPDGKTLASGISDNSIKIWDVASGKQIKTLSGHSNSVQSVAFSPDGRTLASGSDDKSIKIWDVASGKQIKTLSGHSNSVSSVTFSPDGKTLASGSWDNTIKIWDVATGKELQTLTGHSSWVNSVAFSPDGRTLASGSDGKTIKLWRVSER